MARLKGLTLAFLDTHPLEAARVLETLPPAEVAAVLAAVPARLAFPVLEYMLPAQAARCLAGLDVELASPLLRRLGPRTSAAVLRHISPARRRALLEQLPAATHAAVRLFLRYPVDSAGALADVDLVVLPVQATVKEALARLKGSPDDTGDFLYIVDDRQRLHCCLRPAALLHAPASQSLGELGVSDIPCVAARASAQSLRDHPGWIACSTLPVVEADGRFVGALRQAVLMRALSSGDEATRIAETGNLLGTLAGGIWALLSGLLTTSVSVLPVTSRHGDKP